MQTRIEKWEFDIEKDANSKKKWDYKVDGMMLKQGARCSRRGDSCVQTNKLVPVWKRSRRKLRR